MISTTNAQRPRERFEKLFRKGVNEFALEHFGGASIYFKSAQGCAERVGRCCSPEDKNKEVWLRCGERAALMIEKCSAGRSETGVNLPDTAASKEIAAAKKGAPGRQPNVNSNFNPRDYIRTNGPSLGDIDGLEEAKQALFETMIAPFQQNNFREIYKIKAGGGILYYGPPGTGKSTLAAAAAKEISATFFEMPKAHIMSKWVGEAEQNVKAIFDAARAEKRAIVFLDDAEHLLCPDNDSSGVTRRIFSEILTCTSGLEDKCAAPGTSGCVLFMVATNAPWAIVSQMGRRVPHRIYVRLPDIETRKLILARYTRGLPLAEDVDFSALAGRTEGYSGAELEIVCNCSNTKAYLQAIKKNDICPLTQAMFLEQLEKIKPVATRQMLEEYEAWTARFGANKK